MIDPTIADKFVNVMAGVTASFVVIGILIGLHSAYKRCETDYNESKKPWRDHD